MKKILKSPFDLVAEVLVIRPELLTENSAMGETPNWDSLNHIAIIEEIEKCYGITIPNDEIEKYVTMRAIIEVYNKQSGNINLPDRIIEALKNNPIGKIFFK
jgi:acyl carrier protein